MMKNYIFCYTGTGNSLKLASDLAQDLGHCEIIPIQTTPPPTITDAQSIGIIFPVFFMDAPHIVQNYVKKLKLPKTYIYTIVTCGRLAGNSLATIQTLLAKNEHQLNNSFKFIMADSIPFPEFLPNSPKTRVKQQNLYEAQYQNVIHTICNQREQPSRTSNPFVTAFSAFRTRNLATFDDAFTINSNCISCGICVQVCGANNISILNHGDIPKFHNSCSACMACFHYCPKNAITFNGHDQTWFHYTNPDIKLIDRIEFYNQK